MKTGLDRWAKRVSVTAALAVVLSGCAPAAAPAAQPAGAGQPAAAPAAPAQKVTLKVGTAGRSDITAPQAVGVEKGFFEKYGLDVKVTEYASGSAAQEAILGGSADIIHYFPPGAAAAIAKGAKQKIIATDQFRPNAWYIMTAAKSNIQAMKDLEGKKIAITAKGSTTDYFTLWAIQNAKIKAENLPVGFPALYQSVLTGQVDAGVIPPPLSFQALATGEMRPLVDFGKEMPPNLPSVFVASDDIIAKNPKAVENYVKGFFDSLEYMKKNRDYTVDFLTKFSKQDKAIAEKSFEVIIMTMSDDGIIQKEWLDNSLSLGKLGGLTDLPAPDKIWDPNFAKKR
ncbi:MAG: ABC transporter substrate-binding protein [Dehalococcoidia bacterium]|nr:ABC transporter substrate-binding protein [Dehalococcoidia bacterium]